MRRWSIMGLALLVAMILATTAVAQSALQGRPSYGTFGPRTLGQPLAPRQTQGTNLQRGPSGNFLYRGQVDGATNFSAPWRRIDASVLVDNPRYQSALQATEQQMLIQPSVQPPQAEAAAALSNVPVPVVNESLDAGTMAPDVAAVVPVSKPPALATAANVPIALPSDIAMTPSATLSDRVTRVARQRDMLASQQIVVSFGGGIARLEGVVRTSQDRRTLANVLGLEPNVYAIDNRLSVRGDTPK